MKRTVLLIGLLVSAILSLTAGQVVISDQPNQVRLVTGSHNRMTIEMTLGAFNVSEVRINDEIWYDLSVKNAGLTLEQGLPQVPVLAGSVIIPPMAAMDLTIVGSDYVEYKMPVAPSKGSLTRDIDPASVPYSFDTFYQSGIQYPASHAVLTEPFIISDFRGITVHFQPFVYYPQTQTLRVYSRIEVELRESGLDSRNTMTSPQNSYSCYFESLYRDLFLNWNDAKYPVVNEVGRILVIKNSMFDAALVPYVDWKRQNGFQVDVVDVNVAGPTAIQIKSYLQDQYNLNNGLKFVQIFGDAPQVPSLLANGGGSDPSFALLAGNDSYPDIFVGRFSAETVEQIETQVLRTVHYERDIQGGSGWIAQGMGIASNEGGGSQGDNGESDQAHMELIRGILMNYGYTSVDQMYQNYGATAAQVSNNVNAGRGFINYVGHGSATSWSTTGFSSANVNQLVNNNMLPFIVSVACVNGNFVSQTCFAEAWLRAINNQTGVPTGAIAMYASTVNQQWSPPMRGQDHIVELMVGGQMYTIGGLYFNGASRMVEVYGTNGANEYKNWHIFGDASLMVRTQPAAPMTATYDPILFLGFSTFNVQTVPKARVTLMSNGVVYGTAVADIAGAASVVMANPPAQPMDMTLTITAFNCVTLIDTIQILPSTGPYVVVNQHIISDGNNNVPDYGEVINLNLHLNNVGAFDATGVQVQITSTDPYLTILTGNEMIGNIPANGVGQTTQGFMIHIANNVPDQHVAQFTVTITSDSLNVWEYPRNFVINAPSFSFGSIQVDDSNGNNNGRIDSGETVIITIPLYNVGHSQATNVMSSLLLTNVTHVVTPISAFFSALPPTAEASLIYEVTFSSQIPVGTVANLILLIAAGDYSASQNFSIPIGIVMEDFSSGGFNSFPWLFTGGNWTIDTTSPQSGTTCARSATITHSQSTTMSVTLNVPVAGNVSFWRKVSSEVNYDYLKFYVNNILKDQWSGDLPWAQASYAVLPGLNTFKWEYVKDYMVSSGSDCAWIDTIVFPTTGGTSTAPIFTVTHTNIAFQPTIVNNLTFVPLTISNTGDAVMIGTISAQAPFSVALNQNNPVYSLQYLINPMSSQDYFIGFAPTAIGVVNGYLVITSDDPLALETLIPLSGEGRPVSNQDQVTPLVTELKGNFPNPFNPTTTIAFSLKERSFVTIEIYNVLGQKVKTLVRENLDAGNHTIHWHGKDDNGSSVGSGVYFYKMSDGGKYTSTKKMILLK